MPAGPARTLSMLVLVIGSMAQRGLATPAQALTGHLAVGDGSLHVLLVTPAPVPDAARIVMRAEVRRIWNPAGIDVQWLDASSRSDDRVPDLRVTVDREWHSSEASARPAYPIAGLQRPRALVSVSLAGAWRTVRQGLGAHAMDTGPDRLRFNALGLVLGRAIAHEIGHYLLGPAHRDAGLMRPAFNAQEFINWRSDAFELGGADLARIARALRPIGECTLNGDADVSR